jgi:hypothetical protein
VPELDGFKGAADSSLLRDGVRALTPALPQASTALGAVHGRLRDRLLRVARDVLTLACRARSPKPHAALVGTYRRLMATSHAVLQDVGTMARQLGQQLGKASPPIQQSLARAWRRLQHMRTTTMRRSQKTSQPVRLSAAALGALAVLALFGIIVMRSRDQSERRDPLPGRALSFATFAMPANRPAETITLTPTDEAAADARPTKDTVQQFTGDLAIESVPTGAAVFLNQRLVGETPLQLTPLRAGSHAIRIEHEGYERWTTSVIVPAGKQTHLSADLQLIRDR